jgi:hypothetical protein
VNRQKLFEDTWNHFITQNNPPAVRDDGLCSYIKGCAIGRLMPTEWREKAEGGFSAIVPSLGSIKGIPRLADPLRIALDIQNDEDWEFLSALQRWHDSRLTTREQCPEGVVIGYIEIGHKFNLDYSLASGIKDR